MRPITILRSTSQDEIKALYSNTYSKSKYKNVGVLVLGVNDGTEFEVGTQDEVKAHYGLYSLIRAANSNGVMISGLNDEIRVTTTAILKDGSVKEEVVVIPRTEIVNLPETITSLSNEVDTYSFSFKFM